MNREFEVLDRLRAERVALLRERGELLMRGSEAMRAIQSLRASARGTPGAGSAPGEGRRGAVTQGPADLA